MNTKHTGGEWCAKEGQIYPEQTGKTLCLIPYFDDDNEQQQADQKLIAAAPTMLDALRIALNELKKWESYFSESGDIPFAMRSVEEAIQKATQP